MLRRWNHVFTVLLLTGGIFFCACPGRQPAGKSADGSAGGSANLATSSLFQIAILSELSLTTPEEKVAGTVQISVARRLDERMIDYPLVLDRRCPHDKCVTNHQAEQDNYVCPCCGSRFDRDGLRISGPAKRGLRVLYYEVQYGKVLTDPARELRAE